MILRTCLLLLVVGLASAQSDTDAVPAKLWQAETILSQPRTRAAGAVMRWKFSPA